MCHGINRLKYSKDLLVKYKNLDFEIFIYQLLDLLKPFSREPHTAFKVTHFFDNLFSY